MNMMTSATEYSTENHELRYKQIAKCSDGLPVLMFTKQKFENKKSANKNSRDTVQTRGKQKRKYLATAPTNQQHGLGQKTLRESVVGQTQLQRGRTKVLDVST